MKIYHDQVIEAAYLHTKPGCFFIGPFARRVSFASQQRRALHLVEALGEKGFLGSKEERTKKTCAIIGAGLAGLTACAALRGWGCAVHVYERNPHALTAQSKASHRLVHPTIARWPIDPLMFTTEFDFLDWAAGPCDSVIEGLRRDWERLVECDNALDLRVMPNVGVEKLLIHNGRIRLELTEQKNSVDRPGNIQPRQGYDLVIVATGFAEQHAPELPADSYWSEKDQVEAWRAGQRRVLVSGAGDGGLIDALRLVHGDFDGGWLAVRLAHRLGNEFDSEIARAEEQALMAERSIAFMKFGDASGDPGTKRVGLPTGNTAVIRRLESVYTDIARRLPKQAQSLLDASLEKGNVPPGRVTLSSPQPAPFSTFAAPIHKIMIAHALESGAVTYQVGYLRKDAGGEFVHNEETNERTRIRDSELVIRHASPANLETLLNDVEHQTLRLRQLMLADYIDTETPRAMKPPAGYPVWNDGRDADFVRSRYQMTVELMRAVAPGLAVSAVLEGFVCETTADTSAALGASRDIPIPESIFRVPLKKRAVQRVPAL